MKCAAQTPSDTYHLSTIVLDDTYEVDVEEEQIQTSWLNDNHKWLLMISVKFGTHWPSWRNLQHPNEVLPITHAHTWPTVNIHIFYNLEQVYSNCIALHCLCVEHRPKHIYLPCIHNNCEDFEFSDILLNLIEKKIYNNNNNNNNKLRHLPYIQKKKKSWNREQDYLQ